MRICQPSEMGDTNKYKVAIRKMSGLWMCKFQPSEVGMTEE